MQTLEVIKSIGFKKKINYCLLVVENISRGAKY